MEPVRNAAVEDQLRHLAVEAARVGTFVWEPAADVLSTDERFRESLALTRQETAAGISAVVGRVHPDDRERLLGAVGAAVEDRAEFSDAHRVVRPDGSVAHFSLRGCAVQGEDGVLRVLGAAVETTEVHRALEEAEERARLEAQRAALRARAADDLGSRSDVGVLGTQLATLVVPQLADWCVVSVVEGDGPASRATMTSAGWWHADAGLLPLVARAAALPPEQLVQAGPAPEEVAAGPFGLLLRGRVVVLGEGAAEQVAAQLPEGGARDAVLELDPEGAVLLPLLGREEVVGVLSCFTGRGRPVPCGEDLELLVDLAARAGLAVESARVVTSQQQIAEALQRALLTAPPQPDDLEVVVRYTPAAHSAQVGGDWYDAFVQPGGSTVLVIGDVVGHDTAAAAAMGQLRGMLRGLGVVEDVPPAQLLARLDTAMRRLDIDTTATAVVARLEQTPAQRRAGTTTLRWSSAGHLPPVVLTPDGRARLLDGATGLLLGLEGITGGSWRHEHTESVPRGSTVLLCTDGLVERRDAPLDVGVERFLRAVEAARDHDLDDLCDAVLLQLVPRQAPDDVALLGVRMHPQHHALHRADGPPDQPRPAG
ncbi:SpoIIE family protein phosphatase [Quadrisphaera sp. INWT6]|uniref:SpoIIE family protein phosphatase n=1 Tax=Quadrisphaera sp. INWT6 TaxID=2596917 RepID=UPI001891FE48|nr:SpoIIE family protein phosphatase [Quadrisphaera sp. INWT6]